MSVAGRAQCAFRAPGRKPSRSGPRARSGIYSGFTLVELLVVIAVIAVVAALLFPVFAAAKETASRSRCAAQLKQLVAAAIAYADDNSGRYVPAAKDIFAQNPPGGRWRWHGYRERSKEPFDPRKGPLWSYLARSGGLKQCPSALHLKGVQQFAAAFEPGCGGYGYNAAYVGGTAYRNPYPEAAEIASLTSDIASPQKTVMFTDAAMAMFDVSAGKGVLVEYSFAEPPLSVFTGPDGRTQSIPTSSPSIHFRHGGRVTVGWVDGHVTSERLDFTRPGLNAYRCANKDFQLGWFGPADNTLFDNR